MKTGMRIPGPRCTGIIVAAVLVSALSVAAQNDSNRPLPGIGAITRHGMAGVVTSVNGSAVVMEIPESVSFTIHAGPSTSIAGAGQAAAITDIHPGDAILASGDIDEQARIIEAQSITIQPPLAARMLQNLRASFGKTWTAGIVTAVDGNSISVKRRDGQIQTFSVDQDTAWRLNDRQGTSAMLHAGESIRVQLLPAGPAEKVTIQGNARPY